MSDLGTFDEVLTSAILFFLNHGFTNTESLIYWNKRLEKAARKELLSTTQINERLKFALTTEYVRLVERGLALVRHPINKSVINKIKPELRALLANRMAAATTLIRLTREEDIVNMLRRFSGWASSLPPAPSKNTHFYEIRKTIRRTLKEAEYRESELLVDQRRKLCSNLHHSIATAGGAIAANWISKWRNGNYDYREQHRDFSEQGPYLIRNSWAHKQGLLDTIGATFTDQLPHQPGQVPGCQCYFDYIYRLEDLSPNLVKKVA